MLSFIPNPIFVFLGLFVSILVGLTGMGGGALTTPLLILLGIPPTAAVGSDIAFTSITRGLGSILHWKRSNIDFGLVKLILMGSVPSTIASYFLYSWLKSYFGLTQFNAFLTGFLALLLVSVSAIGIYRTISHKRREGERRKTRKDGEEKARTSSSSNLNQEDDGGAVSIIVQKESASTVEEDSQLMEYSDLSLRNKSLIVALGAFVGFAFQFTSVGSGTILIFFLMFLFKSRKIVGTDIFHAFILTLLGTLLHSGLGDIRPDLVFSLAIGGVPGIFLGVALNSRVSVPRLRDILSVTVLAAGLVLILKILLPTIA